MDTRTAARRRTPARARTAAATGLLAAALLLTGCGSDEPGSGATASEESSSPTGSPSGSPTSASPSPSAAASSGAAESEPEGPVVEVRIQGGEVSPMGERVDVRVGEPVTFRITADTAGEMHVHSVPESEIEFGSGTTEETVTVQTPGLVEVELHDPAVTVVQLEAR